MKEICGVTIGVFDNGEMRVHWTNQDKIVVLGALEMAKEVVINSRPQPENGLVKPPMGLQVQ